MSTLAGSTTIPTLDSALGAALRRWRRRRLVRLLAVAAAVFLLVLVGAAFGVRASGFHETTIGALRLALWITGALLVAAAVGVAFVRRPPRPAIARYVEEIDPSLDGALVTAADPAVGTAVPALAQRLEATAVSRAARATGRRRVDTRSDLFAATVLASAVALMIGVLAGGPPELRRAMGLLVALPGSAQAEALPFIQVEPGDINVAEHADLAVFATLGNHDASEATLVVRRGGWETGLEERIGMAQESDGRWTARLFDLDTIADYLVEAGGIQSARFRVTVSALPYVSSLDLEYRYPRYTGLAPDTVQNGGDIVAVAGTAVTLTVTPTIPARGGRVVTEGADTVALTPLDSSSLMTGTFSVVAPGFYRVELQSDDGRWHPASLDYVIDIVPDAAPLVRMSRPGRDVQATSLEELYLQAEASDDFGVSSLELVYSVNGGDDVVVPLWRGGSPGRREVSAGHTFYLEELELQPGDLVAYHARARDADAVKGPKSAQTDIFFVTIRPFSRDYRQGESGGMPGGQGGEQPSDIVRVQREIVAGTYNASRDRARTGETEYRERLATLALSQGRLQTEVRELVGRIQQRGFLSGDTTMVVLAATLDTASAAMTEAERRLTQRDADGALSHERRALAYAQRAQAIFNEVTVNFGAQQGGGAPGGEAQNAEDLADLFSLETDKLRNQYETLARSSEQEAQLDREVDELRERLRQLAARQQRENEEARRLLDSLARAGGQATGGGSSAASSQRARAEEAEEEARRLERLARERQSPALQEGAQRLRDAAEAMRRAAAASSRSGSRESAEALDRLREAARALDREAGSSIGESLERAAEAARRLEQDQRSAAGRAAREAAEAQRSTGARQGSQQDRLARAEAVEALERELDRVARQGRRERPEAAREAQAAANAIRNERIADKLRYSADRMGVLDGRSATSLEEMIAENLAGVRERVEQAQRAAASAEGRDPAAALERARSLVRGLESLQERDAQRGEQGQAGERQGDRGQASRQQGEQSGEGAQSGDSQGRSNEEGSGQGTGGGSGQEAERGGGVTSGSTVNSGGGGMGVVPAGGLSDRQRAREVAARRAEGEELRRQLARQGMDVRDVDRLLEQMRRLESMRVSNDPEEVARLQAALVEGWKLVEFQVLRAAVAGEGAAPLERRLEAISPEYREAVERYYRTLAGRRDGGNPQ